MSMGKQQVTGTIITIVILLVVVLSTAYAGAAMVGMRECQALGFEWGTVTLYPEFGVQCEYRLRVPLRDVRPPIEGASEDAQRL